MLRNYFTVALRNILKHKFFSVINLAGLTVGITACLFIFIYVKDELSYDRFHSQAEHIYRIGLMGRMSGQEFNTTNSSYAVGPAMVSEIPGVTDCVRLWPASNTVAFSVDEKAFNEKKVFYADSNFFSFFSFSLIEGLPEKTLTEPNTVVITEDLAKKYFGNDAEIYFVLNGTAANVLSLQSMMRSYHAVICADTSHIQMDECGAPEKIVGCKLITVPTKDGKLTPQKLKEYLARVGDQHAVQPRVISISQSTEYGTVYNVDEIRALADFAHQHHMYLHMDGARIANAAVTLKCEFREFTRDAGVDILSFGGTKNGMMLGEAVVIFNPELASDFRFIRKQGMQLASKMRFISAQFNALLSNDLWSRNAGHANQMAALMGKKLQELQHPDVRVTQAVQANAVFAVMPENCISRLQEQFHFYTWDARANEVRLMASFDTREEDIQTFIDALIKELSVL